MTVSQYHNLANFIGLYKDYINSITNETKKKGSKIDCIRKLVALANNCTEAEGSIVLEILALIQKLPVRTMMEGTVQGETELWSVVFDPILSSILSNPEKDVILIWSNFLSTKGSSSNVHQVHPDVMICEIEQLIWGKMLDFGEVKLVEVAPSLNGLGQDLLRLATLNKNALLKSSLSASMSFQIHVGYNTKVYMSKVISKTSITAMIEVLSLEFPSSVNQLDSFITRRSLDILVHFYDVFRNNCINEREAEATVTPNMLELSTLNTIKQSTRDRTRPHNLQY